jgi:F0F1-type ATP synthase membrane subunit b/b'
VQKEELTRELTSKHQGIKQAQENIIKELQTKVKELQSKLYKV